MTAEADAACLVLEFITCLWLEHPEVEDAVAYENTGLVDLVFSWCMTQRKEDATGSSESGGMP
jgi:hypothetical protein